jgi:hypothetical protein
VYEFQDPAAREVVARVLDSHPEGQSLLAEAGHRRSLADQSALVVAEAFSMAKTARLGYEALCHRLDPRHLRTMHVVLAVALLVAVIVGLMGLDDIEFASVLPGWMSVAAAAAATAVWTGCAWLVALAAREERHGRLITVGIGAVAAAVLLAGLNGESSSAHWGSGWHRFGVSVLVALFILGLVTVTTEIIRRTEPASLLLARRRWHRAWENYATAVRTQRSDAEAAVVAAEEWCSLVDAYATSYAASAHPDGSIADGSTGGCPASGNGHVTSNP